MGGQNRIDQGHMTDEHDGDRLLKDNLRAVAHTIVQFARGRLCDDDETYTIALWTLTNLYLPKIGLEVTDKLYRRCQRIILKVMAGNE